MLLMNSCSLALKCPSASIRSMATANTVAASSFGTMPRRRLRSEETDCRGTDIIVAEGTARLLCIWGSIDRGGPRRIVSYALCIAIES